MKPLRKLIIVVLTITIAIGCNKDNLPMTPTVDESVFQGLSLAQANSYLTNQGFSSTVSSRRDTLTLGFYDNILQGSDSAYYRTRQLKPLLQNMVSNMISAREPKLPANFNISLEVYYSEENAWDLKSMFFYFVVNSGSVS